MVATLLLVIPRPESKQTSDDTHKDRVDRLIGFVGGHNQPSNEVYGPNCGDDDDDRVLQLRVNHRSHPSPARRFRNDPASSPSVSASSTPATGLQISVLEAEAGKANGQNHVFEVVVADRIHGFTKLRVVAVHVRGDASQDGRV